MHTHIPVWKYTLWFLISGLLLGVSSVGIYLGFTRGFSGSITRQANPIQFTATLLLFLCGVAIGLGGVLIGLAAIFQAT